jgi:hypothetical protein
MPPKHVTGQQNRQPGVIKLYNHCLRKICQRRKLFEE